MKKLKGSVTVFAMLMLGMVIGMYLMGFSSPIVYFIQQNVMDDVDQGDVDTDDLTVESETVKQISGADIISLLISKIASIESLGFIGLSFGLTIAASILGAGYIGQSILSVTIPAYIIFLLANIFFFPVMDYDVTATAPAELNILLVIIFNTLLALTIVSFIMGRE